jgi:hypothetical protein
MGFFKLVSANASDEIVAGKGIIDVSKSVFSDDQNSEWAKFDRDPSKWLFEHNYRYVDINGAQIGNGHAPATLHLVPVYDTENQMHVRIPWKGDLAAAAALPVPSEQDWGNSFPRFLARYFVRKCR